MASLDIIFPLDKSCNKNIIIKSLNRLSKINNANRIIVCNDMDFLNSLEINLSNFIIIYKHFSNCYQAFNRGIDKSSSDFISFIRPENLVEDTYNILINSLNDSIDILSFYYSVVKENVNVFINKNDTFNREGEYDLSKVVPKCYKNVFNSIYKRSIISNNQISFDDLSSSPEMLFNFMVFSKCKVYKVVTTNAITTTSELIIDDSVQKSIELHNRLVQLYPCTTGELKSFIAKYKNNLKNFIFKENIDFVFPYVTSDDENWRDLYKKALRGNESAWEAGVERFRDNGLLKYVFRSIEKYMPWIRNVCMIVMSENQVPSWVNKSNVKIITHDMFIPKEFQPVFNSNTIEMFLSKIPYVTDLFIYSNDDLITFKDKTPDYFFYNGNIPSYQLTFRDFNPNAPADYSRRNCYNLIMDKPDNKKRVISTQHGTMSYNLNNLKECYSTFENKIKDSCTTFRTNENYSQYIYGLYQMIYKTIDNDRKDIVSYAVRKSSFNSIMKDDFSKHDFICLNDDNSSTSEEWKSVLKKIEGYLPNKSKYEL